MKTCTKCGEVKELTLFYPHKGMPDGRRPDCKKCHTAESNKRTVAWRKANPSAARDERRARTLSKYRLTPESYEKKLADQDGKCWICRDASPGPGFIHFMVDHDHGCCPGEWTCGQCVRGLLCSYCNTLCGRYERLNDRGRLDLYLSEFKGEDL